MADKSQLKAILQDVRKMRRAVSLRQETDPEKVATILEVILKEAIVLKTSGFDTLGKGAVNELRNLRRDMIAGQVNAGASTNKVIGMYSHVLDTIDQAEAGSAKVEKESGGGLGSAIIKHLPSTDTLAAALMTANPMMGYVAKIGIDFVRSRRQATAMAKKEHDDKISNLRAEADRIAEEAKMVDEKLVEQRSKKKEAKESNRIEPVINEEDVHPEVEKLVELKEELATRLDHINTQLEELNDIWRSPSKQEEKLERIADQTEDANSRLDRIYDQDRNKINEERSKADIEEMQLREKESESNANQITAGNVSALTEESQANALDEKLGAMLTGLWAGIGAAAGGFIATLLSPFKKLFSLLGAGAKMLAPLLRGAGFLSAIMAVFDFVDGFSNAADILGKSEDQVTVFDKIRVGASHIVAGFITMIDNVLDYVGLGFLDDSTTQSDITKKIFEGGDAIIDYLLTPFNFVKKYLEDNGGMSGILDKIRLSDTMESVLNFILTPAKYINEILESYDSGTLMTTIKKYFFDTLGTITGVLKTPLNAINTAVAEYDVLGKYEQVKKYVSDSVDTAITFIKSPFIEILDYIDNFSVTDKVNEVIKDVGSVFDDIGNSIKKLTEGISKWIDDKIKEVQESWVGKGVTSAISWLVGEEKPIVDSETMEGVDQLVISNNTDLNQQTTPEPGIMQRVQSWFLPKPAAPIQSAISEDSTNRRIEEVEKNSSVLSSSMESIANQTANNNQVSPTIVNAPTTTSINNTTNVEGSSGVRNNDNTWRRTNNRNLGYQ